MNLKSTIVSIFIFLFSYNIVYAESDYVYCVEITGIDDQDTLTLLTHESQLLSLIETPPLTGAGLQRRIEDDVAILLKALQSKAYYNASIKPVTDKSASPIRIQLVVETGPVFIFKDFEILPEGHTGCCPACSGISLEDIGIAIGDIAYPAAIIEAEEDIISILEKRGYPLAKLGKREVIADLATHTISVKVPLNCGPLAYFGETEVSGCNDLLPVFFCRKIAWQSGAMYNPALVNRTLNALELSGLFSSINITHDEEVEEDGSLPMHIVVDEAKRRSIGFGLGYGTILGFGMNADWEHRNVSRRGDKLSFVANIWQIKQEGFVRYVLPDFLIPRQDLIWLAEAEHENVKAFRELSVSVSLTLEKQINDRLRISGGLMYTKLRNTHSENNGTFSLIKLPLQTFWNGADRVMDPTKGITLHFKSTPTLQTEKKIFSYLTNLLTLTTYTPLDADRRFILAGKASFGSIWGANKSIPSSERFYAGSDNLLRGYHYWTVSPLEKIEGKSPKPIGGRSLMIFSLEARMRIRDPFGLVLFYDIGNVYSEPFPQFNHRQRQSAGFGLRYHTPVGPIRLDIAFPFNPRRHLDSSFQVYFSIGQSF